MMSRTARPRQRALARDGRAATETGAEGRTGALLVTARGLTRLKEGKNQAILAPSPKNPESPGSQPRSSVATVETFPKTFGALIHGVGGDIGPKPGGRQGGRPRSTRSARGRGRFRDSGRAEERLVRLGESRGPGQGPGSAHPTSGQGREPRSRSPVKRSRPARLTLRGR